MLADVNAYCHAHGSQRHCDSAPAGNAYDSAVTDYAITDFGVIHEIDRDGANGNLHGGPCV